jgi:DNA ligase-1
METVIDILEAIESDNSRNYKEEVLRRNRGNDLLKYVFVSTSDPYTNFYISKFKMPSALGADGDDEAVATFLEVIHDELATRKSTGNAAKAIVNRLFERMTVRQQKWCLRILLRNLRVGVMETTINKIWPGSISKFSVQLAESLASSHVTGRGIVITEEVRYPVRVEPKLDGLRCIAIKHDGVVTMFTRSGSLIETLPTIKAEIEAAPWDDFVLDAEVMGRDWNESASVVMSHKVAKDDSGMVLNVFDAMHFDDWRTQTNSSPLPERIELVSELVSQIDSSRVICVQGMTVESQDKLMDFYSKSMEMGYEGIMLKDLSSPYVFKRTDAVLKLKPVSTFEGVVVGHYEGNRGTKREGLWGGFQVLMPNGIVTNCGGGFNDKQRAEIGIDPDSWIGRIVELEGQPDPLTPDGLTADGRIRFPVFIRERDSRDVDTKVIDAYVNWKPEHQKASSE